MSAIAPLAFVTVDGELFPASSWVVEESLASPAAVARVELGPSSGVPAVPEGARVEVHAGTTDLGVELVFSGVAQSPARYEQVAVFARDSVADALVRTPVTRGWMRSRPGVVASDLCSAAGVSLDESSIALLGGLPERLRWVCRGLPALEGLREMLAGYGRPEWRVLCDGAVGGGVWIGPESLVPAAASVVQLGAASVLAAELADGNTQVSRATVVPGLGWRRGVTLVADGRAGIVTRVRRSGGARSVVEVEWRWKS
jgi:hypothetical protein